jgi:energy-converting hydrogenase A subunit I
MNKQHALLGTIATGLSCAGAVGLAGVTILGAEVVLIVAFPLFVVFLGLWWNAREGEEDIPFLGY